MTLSSLSALAQAYHCRLAQVLPRRLADLKAELDAFEAAHELNGFQTFILHEMYMLDLPQLSFPVRSLLIAAVPHPLYARAIFTHEGREHACKSLTASEEGPFEQALEEALAKDGYHIQAAPSLPMKRLAVQSGLARYGRNNITYVDHMGSALSLHAYLTDLPCDEDAWRPMENAPPCEGCGICTAACPTQAIRPDRFLIDNSICLSAINEGGGAFPDWLSPDVHHAPYDCLRCQLPCPMNAAQVRHTGETVTFTEAETALLLGGDYTDLPPALLQKTDALHLLKWTDSLPRNLRAIFAQDTQR